MNFKKFLWPTKEKLIATLAVFILLNVFFLPVQFYPVWSRPEHTLEFRNIFDYPMPGILINKTAIDFLIIGLYLPLAYLASCTFFAAIKKQ